MYKILIFLDLIGFVDSDDWIDPDMYETLYRTMVENDADISMCGHYYSYMHREKPSCSGAAVAVYSGSDALQMIIEDRKIKSFLMHCPALYYGTMKLWLGSFDKKKKSGLFD